MLDELIYSKSMISNTGIIYSYVFLGTFAMLLSVTGLFSLVSLEYSETNERDWRAKNIWRVGSQYCTGHKLRVRCGLHYCHGHRLVGGAELDIDRHELNLEILSISKTS